MLEEVTVPNSISNRWFVGGNPTASLLVPVLLLIWLANSFFLQARSIVYHNDPADIAAYYAAAEVKRTDAGSIYNTSLLNDIGAKRQTGTEVRPYIYPPLLAEILSPAAALSFRAFRLIYLMIMHLLLVAYFYTIVTLVIRHFSGTKVATASMATLLVMVLSSAVERDLFTGQINIPLALAVGLVFLLDSRKHYLLVGLLIALTALTKLFFAVFILYFLFRRRYHAAASAVVFMMLLTLSSVAVFGAGDWIHYTRMVLPSFASQIYPSDVHDYTDLTTSNYSLLNFMRLLADGFGSTISVDNLTILHKVMVACILLVFSSIFWKGRNGRENPIVDMQLLVCLVMLVAPIVWSHWFVYLIPGLVYTACLHADDRLSARESVLLISSFALVTLADYGPNIPVIERGPLLVFKLLKLYGLVLFTGLLVKFYLTEATAAVIQDSKPDVA